MSSAYDRLVPDAYVQMSRELAPYQGRPHPEARPVGDPAAGTGAPPASDPDRARAEEVAHAYRQVGASSIAAPELSEPTSDVALQARMEEAVVPDGVVPTVALSESVPGSGGVLVPARYAQRSGRTS